jgi:2-polyprenyl-3-methyl-5-hydroxy-6-metoxy-1,4-benzoquinol methylase
MMDKMPIGNYEYFLGRMKELVNNIDKEIIRYKSKNVNYLGEDVEKDKLKLIEEIYKKNSSLPQKLGKDDIAQIKELAFWRWTAFEGYVGHHQYYFPWIQEINMLSYFIKTGWDINELRNMRILEIGCGPMGMVEFIPGKEKIGFDPLNEQYSRLFKKVRVNNVKYVSNIDDIKKEQKKSFDLVICFNVLDHLTHSRELFELFMSLLKDKGRFIIQVNTIKEGEPRSEEHSSIHPSPFTSDKILSWIKEISSEFNSDLSNEKTVDNEYFFMAWGYKNKSNEN